MKLRKGRAELTIKRYPSKGTLKVKDKLLNTGKFVEQDIIETQKQFSSKRHSTGLYVKPLSRLMMFFDAQFYLEVDDENHNWKLHLFSQVPSSLTEIRILKDRMKIAYGDLFEWCSVYQAPLYEEEANKWINLRRAEDDQAYSQDEYIDVKNAEKISETGINRKVGFIYKFKGDYSANDKGLAPLYEGAVSQREANTNGNKETRYQWLRALLEMAISLYTPHSQVDIKGFSVKKLSIDEDKVLHIEMNRADTRLALAFGEESIKAYLCQLLGLNEIKYSCAGNNVEIVNDKISDQELDRGGAVPMGKISAKETPNNTETTTSG